jgi:hypothetical protein
MASTIITKNSSTAGAVPLAANLTQGELAINTTDRRLYTKDATGTVVEVGSGTAIVYRENFSGNDVTTVFTMAHTPVNEDLVDIYINGIYQNKDTFSVSTNVITFTEAPVSGTDNIEVMIWQSAPIGSTDANYVSYTPAGTGAVATTVQERLRAFDEVTKPESLGGDFVQRVIDPGSGGAYSWMWGHKNNSLPLTDGGNFVFGGTSSFPHSIGSGSFLCVIGGAYDNTIGTSSEASTIAGGAHHIVGNSASHAAILGGSYQTVNASYGVAVGGTQNTAQSTYSFVGGGQSNTAGDNALPALDTRSAFVGAGSSNAAKGIRSAVVAGSTNLASGAEAFVGAGNNNTASGEDAVVGGGSSNTASGSKSVVAGGEINTASGTASFAAGSTNTASGNYSVALGEFNLASNAGSNAIGIRASSYLRGQRSHASGYFAARGDAQASDLVARNSTTGAAAIDLDLNGGTSNKLVLPDNTTWGFVATVAARRSDADGENAFYEFKGCIKRDGTAASTAIVGSVTKTVIAEDTAGWDVNITADTTNGAMKINCTGTTGTIRWVARVELTEVSG